MYSAGARHDRETSRILKENASAPILPMTDGRSGPVSGPTSGHPTTAVSTERESAHGLLSSAIHDANDSIHALEMGIAEAADTFRHGTPDDASIQLLRVVDTLRLLTIVAGIGARALHVDLASIRAHDGIREPAAEMGLALAQLSAHQFAENWNAVADTLETSVSSALASWRDVFAVLQIEADLKLGARVEA